MSDPTSPGDEAVEVVDLAGNVVEIVSRRRMRAERLRHRATFIAVVDETGRLLVHQRSPAKDVWPSRWDIAAGGVAAVGETWAVAAARELEEELGLRLELTSLGTEPYEDEDVATLGAIFTAVLVSSRHDEVRFADGEVVDARWVTREELDAMVRRESFCPDSLALVLPRLGGFGPRS